jgi:hypothetical protein
MPKKLSVFFAGLIMLVLGLVVYAGSAGATDGPDNPAGTVVGQADDLTCTQCHNDTTIITGKHTAWEESVHGSGEAYVRGTSASCAGCHSGGGFSEMVAAGLTPGQVEAGDPNPTRQDCRACHNIHTTYTAEDWSLETTDAVALYAFEGVTFDGGEGNLCANCHQPRRQMEVVDGMVTVDSTHWGPHHGPQSATLLGIAGAGVEDSPSPHLMVPDTCVTCHVANDNHSFEPSVAVCQQCHGEEVEDFDIEGVQTKVDELAAELGEALKAKGLLEGEGADAHPVLGDYPEAEAAALWNWLYIVHEDKSHGVHNPDYIIALLEASIAALQ